MLDRGSEGVCVGPNYVGVRMVGYMAVAYTTLLAYCCYVAFHWCICRRLLGVSVIPVSTTVKIVAVLGVALAADWLLTDRLVFRWLVTAILLVTVVWPVVRDQGGISKVIANARRFVQERKK